MTWDGTRHRNSRYIWPYSQLVEKLAEIAVDEKEVNICNKLSRGKFTAAFLLQCLKSLEVSQLHLD